MTKQEEQLIEGFKKLSAVPWIVEVATVTEVDTDKLSCVVMLLADDTEIPNVRLKAGIDNIKDGLVQIPKIGKPVLIARINNDVASRCIVAYSEVEVVKFFDGENGGLVKWPNAKTELDKVKDILTALLNIISGSPIPEPGSGSPSAFQSALSAAVVGLQTPSFEDLSNEKVKH